MSKKKKKNRFKRKNKTLRVKYGKHDNKMWPTIFLTVLLNKPLI